MVEGFAPGKLYIAGEYAVVEPGHSAVVVALDRFVKVIIEPQSQRGRFFTFANRENPIYWERKDGQIVLDERDDALRYVLQAIHYVESYAESLGKDLVVYDLTVESALADKNGHKYGLGSSAAVTVATIRALLKLYEIEITPLMLFKLAAMVHLKVQGNGSCGDIAASVYGGWLHYTSFDQKWLLDQLSNDTAIADLLNMDWPYLGITMIKAPKSIRLVVGWTGSPASTPRLVDQIHQSKEAKAKFYQAFLDTSEACVTKIVTGLQQDDFSLVVAGIKENRDILNQLGDMSAVTIETNSLNQLCEIAIDHSGAAKSSGAGGGDCGIVILPREIEKEMLYDAWENVGIKHLSVEVYEIEE